MQRNLFLAAAFSACLGTFAETAARGDEKPVYVIRIDDGVLGGEGMVDYWLVRFLQRHLREAERTHAEAVIFDIETNGGLVRAAFAAAETISDSKLKTIAFVDHRAFSAGALLTLACKEIYMLKGSSMGAALPIMPNPKGGVVELPKKAEEKIIRSLVSAFRSTAERSGHDPALAAAMVDPALEVIRSTVDGKPRMLSREEFTRLYTEGHDAVEGGVVVKAGEIFAPTTSDAVAIGLAKGEVNSLDELLSVLGFASRRTVRVRAGTLENLARFLAGPMVSGVLILLAVIGIGIELKTPGFGAGGAVFILALGLYLWGKFFAGAASPLEIAMFFVGIVLLAVELFLIPGFGVVGITGVSVMIASVILSALPPDAFSFSVSAPGTPVLPPSGNVVTDLASVIIPLALGLVLLLVIIGTMNKLPFARWLVLEHTSQAALPETPSPEKVPAAELLGRAGIAATVLRPAGRIEIDGKTFDAVTRGELIKPGTPVKVAEVSGNRIVVERA